MPGAHLRRERAIYAQKNEDVSFATGKKETIPPIYVAAGTWIIMSSAPFSPPLPPPFGRQQKDRIFTARSIIVTRFRIRNSLATIIVGAQSIFWIGNENKSRKRFCAIARIDARRCTRARGGGEVINGIIYPRFLIGAVHSREVSQSFELLSVRRS